MKDMRWDGSWSRSGDRIHWFPIALSHLRSIWFCFEQSRNPIFWEAQCHQSRHSRNASMTVSQELAGSSPNHFISCVFSAFFYLFGSLGDNMISHQLEMFSLHVSIWKSMGFSKKTVPNTMFNWFNCPSSKAAQLLKAARKVVAKPEANESTKDGWGVTFWDPKKGEDVKKNSSLDIFRWWFFCFFWGNFLMISLVYVSK